MMLEMAYFFIRGLSLWIDLDQLLDIQMSNVTIYSCQLV